MSWIVYLLLLFLPSAFCLYLKMDIELVERRVTASVLRLQIRSPFFATLALFSRIHVTETTATAATNGRDIFISPQFAQSLDNRALDGLLLHEVLHAALLHVVRCQERDRLLWNIAADIVVNGMVAQQQGMVVPQGGICNRELEQLSVEEIYEILQDQQAGDPSSYSLTLVDLQLTLGSGGQSEYECGNDRVSLTALEVYWRDAMQQAIAIAESNQAQSIIPQGFQREIGQLTRPQVDWRTYLWRFMVKTPTDFIGFDRRFIGQGLYLDVLDGESVKVYVAIDTSGSVNRTQLQLFLSELGGILNAYPHLECELYYADAAVYGPYELTADMALPKPVGGGGTSFVPFFEKVGERRYEQYGSYQNRVCIYLTDGYGTFPTQMPDWSVLWVVTPGGLDLGQFPFGEAVRLLSVS
ncbi:MAG: VWA-like domain-containing protein [Cyanobacteria bacterium P01_F01_bin.150]